MTGLTSGHLLAGGPDFLRDTAGNVPDGANDWAECVTHNGPLFIGDGNASANSQFEYLALVSYTGNGNFTTQTIQTGIPIDSTIMPTIHLHGYGYGTGDIIDIRIGLYTYNLPSGSLLNTVWVSTGSRAPTSIRAGWVGGLLALELTWPGSEYFYRYAVDAYCDGNASAPGQSTYFCGWSITAAALPGTATQIVTIPQKYATSSGAGAVTCATVTALFADATACAAVPAATRFLGDDCAAYDANSIVQSAARKRLSVVTVTGATATTPTTHVVAANAAAGGFTVTLTTPGACDPTDLWVKKTDVTLNVVTITPASGTIDGAASWTLTNPRDGVHLVWTGTDWIILP